MTEHQNIEYKQSWRDEYLKWICAFANAQGGKLLIGIDDKGKVIGVDDYKKLMEDIPNKVVSHMGLVVDVNLRKKSGKPYIEINVPVSKIPVSYQGIYHYRSGSTKQELKGIALQNWLLAKSGNHWEDIPVETATVNDLDKKTIKTFIEKAVEKNRIPANAAKSNINTLLKNLSLMTEGGKLTRAALLLFGKRPSMVSSASSFRIGRFGKALHDLKFQDVIETNLFDMPDLVMEKLDAKYLIRPISYKGLERMEPLEYPEQALREAVLNAIIHKDYSSTWIFLKVYDDKLEIWNPGKLPEELTIEKLKSEHSSYPRNKHIADTFFMAGYIESWGRGTNKIIDACVATGLPEPIIEEDQGGIRITFLKDIYTEEYLQKLNLNERQVKAVLYTKQKGRITNKEYQEINKVSRNTASNDLAELVKLKLLTPSKQKGAGSFYNLI